MLKNCFVPYALLALSQGVFAQQAPTAGSQLQQIPPPPAPQKVPPAIRIEPLGTAPSAPSSDQLKIMVNSLRVTGARVFSEAELIAVTGFTP